MNGQPAAAPFVHPTAVIDEGAVLGDGTKVWHFSHVGSGAVLGPGSNLGQNVFVAPNVIIGSNVKIQNNVSIYDGVHLEDDVFCGPSCVFTNVTNPRAEIVRRGAYEPTRVRRGATICANATIVCGADIGRHAFIGAGAVVTKQVVHDYALMLGVPARQAGWVGRHGHPLRRSHSSAGLWECPESGWCYKETTGGQLRCLNWDEDRRLPTGMEP